MKRTLALVLVALSLSGCRGTTTVEIPERSPALLWGVWEATMTQVNVMGSPERKLRLDTVLDRTSERGFDVGGTATYDGLTWQVVGFTQVGEEVRLRAQYTSSSPDHSLFAKLTLTTAGRQPLVVNLASRLDSAGQLDLGFKRAYFVTLYDPDLKDMLGELRRP